MSGFKYRLILATSEPADPPTLESSTPTWRVGDQIWVRPAPTDRMLLTRDASIPIALSCSTS